MSKRGISDAISMFLVSAISLLLIIYVGFGEAQRTYHQFQVEKLNAQGKILQTAMASYLRAGLPLKQYVGFATRADAILMSDSSVSAITVFDQSGRPVFTAGDAKMPLLSTPATGAAPDDDEIDLRQNDTYVQVALPLRNKFETVGSLTVTMPREKITKRLKESFEYLLVIAGLLSVAFAWFASVAGPSLAGRRTPWLQVVYALTFIAMSGTVVGTLVVVYSEGAQVKTKSLADSLGQRLRDIVDFNINIDEFDGLDQIFEQYRRLNPNISAAGLTVNGKVVIHTNPDAVGMPWVTDRHTFEYVINLTRPEPNANEIHVAVALPAQIVYNQVARSVKNFAALFVATGFLAGLFLQLARSLQWARSPDAAHGAAAPNADLTDFELSLAKSVFFVAVFVEHLTYSFLPQFMQMLAENAGLSESFASAPFMIYYLFFALTLIPAGHYSKHVGPRNLMYLGMLLAAVALLSLAFISDFFLVMLARAAAGIGQAMLFIGVQCYILAKASPGKRTQGAGIIVFGFQGGMISGMAIGSLLVNYMGATGVFTLAGAIAIAMTIYTILFIPAVSGQAAVDYGVGSNLRLIGRDLGNVLHNLEFLKTMFLIGIPTKAVMTGIVIFALPLLLTQQGYAQEDIGQIIMLYAAGVLVASTYVSRLVDRIGRTDNFLFWGAAISGLGLFLIGMSGWAQMGQGHNGETFNNLTTIAGVILVGIAHGFVNAPVVTHVTESDLATKIGANSVAATYRFLERVGHVAGPILVGQMFIFAGQSVTVVTWTGAIVVLLGILFILWCTPTQIKPTEQEIRHDRESLVSSN